MHAAIVALLALGCLFWDVSKSCGIFAAAWLLRTAGLLAQQPEENAGHRIGGKGFDSELYSLLNGTPLSLTCLRCSAELLPIISPSLVYCMTQASECTA